jgi:hypothetical protein
MLLLLLLLLFAAARLWCSRPRREADESGSRSWRPVSADGESKLVEDCSGELARIAWSSPRRPLDCSTRR